MLECFEVLFRIVWIFASGLNLNTRFKLNIMLNTN
jgi:hypothetical protein